MSCWQKHFQRNVQFVQFVHVIVEVSYAIMPALETVLQGASNRMDKWVTLITHWNVMTCTTAKTHTHALGQYHETHEAHTRGTTNLKGRY